MNSGRVITRVLLLCALVLAPRSTLTETSASYGKPSYNSNLAYQARMVQFGFRLAF